MFRSSSNGKSNEAASYHLCPAISPGNDPAVIFNSGTDKTHLKRSYIPQSDYFGKPLNLLQLIALSAQAPAATSHLPLADVLEICEDEATRIMQTDWESAWHYFHSIASFLQTMGLYPDARTYEHRGLTAVVAINNDNQYVRASHVSLGNLFAFQGLYTKALEEYHLGRGPLAALWGGT